MANLPFNSWSRKRIIDGHKDITSRSKEYDDPLVYRIDALTEKMNLRVKEQ